LPQPALRRNAASTTPHLAASGCATGWLTPMTPAREAAIVRPMSTLTLDPADGLAGAVSMLARRNEALEDYAALVARELRNPLLAPLQAEDPPAQIERALALIESLLDAARQDAGEARLLDCLDGAVSELAADGVEITSDLAGTLPVPPGPLQV